MDTQDRPEDRPNWRPHEELGRSIAPWAWAALVGLMLIVAGAGYYFLQLQAKPRRPIVSAPPTAAPVPPAQTPAILHPVPQVEPEPERPLPPLDQSDAPVGERLAGLLGDKAFGAFISPDQLVRRIVVTVDNLPRKVVPVRMRAVKPVPGHFAPGAQNAARYDTQVRLFESLDSRALVRAYARFYPLFQAAYRETGKPDGYFNDRLVEAIDDMLAAPDLKSPPHLVQPKVFYEYAEPGLEGRSAGQKILMRIGAANAAKVKAKLQEIRGELTARKDVMDRKP